jgi:hypothetical protein
MNEEIEIFEETALKLKGISVLHFFSIFYVFACLTHVELQLRLVPEPEVSPAAADK